MSVADEVDVVSKEVAYIVTGGRAAKVAVTRGGRAGFSRRGVEGSEIVGPEDPTAERPDDEAGHGEQSPAILGAASDREHAASDAADSPSERRTSPYAQGL